MITKDEIVKNEILQRAQELFQQYGLKKTTMDEIAAACGKAKSTLYHYFKSKEEVFDAVVEEELMTLRQIVKREVEQQKSLTDKIKVYFNKFHQEILNMLNLYRIAKYEIKDIGRERVYFIKMMDFETAYITRLLEDGYDAGEFRTIDRDDIPWFSEAILASFFGIVRYSIAKEGGIDQAHLESITNILIPRVLV